MSFFLTVAALVILAITALIGFGVFDSEREHVLGWLAAGLLCWAAAEARGYGEAYMKRTRR